MIFLLVKEVYRKMNGIDVILKNAEVQGRLVDIAIKNGVISSVSEACAIDNSVDNVCEDVKVVDIKGKKVFSGLVDIHSHGCLGYDTMDGDMSSLEEMSEYLFKAGVTSWYPTTMTEAIESIGKAVESIPARLSDRADILGFHMEGPFISGKYIGAQNPNFLMSPDDAVLEGLGNIKLVTVAPELSGMEQFISKASELGVRVCIGHTDCSYNEAVSAFESGAVCLTHTFNAMPPLHHREPGPIGAAIMSNGYVQVICDGIHIHKAVITALYRIFGSERMILISDSMRATGIDDGEYMFGGQKVVVSGGVARTEGGALAGSTSTLYTCVMKAIEFGIPADEAFAMASGTPAAMMGIKKGRIEAGYDADFIVVDDNYRLLDVLKFV